MNLSLPPLKCKNCNKEYNRESSYNKHKLLCCDFSDNLPLIEDKLKKKNLSINEAIEICKVPSELMQSVQELIKSNKKLQFEINELKKANKQYQNKKLIVIDWLNKNFKPPLNYKKFMDNLIINRKHLEMIFNSNLVLGIEEILQDYLSESNEKNIPFKSFTQKNNIMYAYNEENKWEKLSSEDFNDIFKKISKGLLTEFTKWQTENEEKLYTEEFSVIYLQNVKKVLGGNTDIEKSQKQIYKNFYQYLKTDFQTIIQYDFA